MKINDLNFRMFYSFPPTVNDLSAKRAIVRAGTYVALTDRIGNNF